MSTIIEYEPMCQSSIAEGKADQEMMVSIICSTFNHEPFIADAIESFVMQKTNFPFEIVINDDASEDSTAMIIREYALKYPNLIKPILQIENQHQKGIKGLYNCRQIATGKYIAICEGDDFWTEPNKLQKQVDYMESHPECALCVHAAYNILPDKRRLRRSIRASKNDSQFSTEEVIQGGGGLFATNSILYPAKLDRNRPTYFNDAPVGDYPLAILLSTLGTVYYMDQFMSAYRVNVPGSWTRRHLSSPSKAIEHLEQIAALLDEINKVTLLKYNQAIVNTKKQNLFKMQLLEGNFKELKSKEFIEIYSALDIVSKLKIFIKSHILGFNSMIKTEKGKADL